MPILSCKRGVPAALLALLAAATMAASPAEAQRRRGGDEGAGIAAGVLGGLAAGAIVGGAIAGPGYADPGYGPEEVDGPDGGPGCPLVRRPVYDGAGRFAGYQAVPAC